MRGEIREKLGSFVGDSRENGVFWRNLRKNGEIWVKGRGGCRFAVFFGRFSTFF